jgi:hypothetical protein
VDGVGADVDRRDAHEGEGGPGVGGRYSTVTATAFVLM